MSGFVLDTYRFIGSTRDRLCFEAEIIYVTVNRGAFFVCFIIVRRCILNWSGHVMTHKKTRYITVKEQISETFIEKVVAH